MQRTQIYLTDEQSRRIAARAVEIGAAKAEVIRRILDAALGLDDGVEERRRAISATAGILADDPDWREWLAGVRGSAADERLRQLDT